MPLFPPIDQWEALLFPLQPMTAHSLSRRVRDIVPVISVHTGIYPSKVTRTSGP